MPHFICPNCKNRSIDNDGRQGLLRQAVSCERCGFGFLFEILDDYYPSPTAGLVACDRDGRILAAGRGVFELTGYGEQELMGKDVVDAFGLEGFEAGKSPIAFALEWGVRRMGEHLELRSRPARSSRSPRTSFPRTTTTAACSSRSRRGSAGTRRTGRPCERTSEAPLGERASHSER